MVNHIHHITLRHWDPAVRGIGSKSLRLICAVAGKQAANDAVNAEVSVFLVRCTGADT